MVYLIELFTLPIKSVFNVSSKKNRTAHRYLSVTLTLQGEKMKKKPQYMLLLLCCISLSASGDSIVADRPGFSTGTATVKPRSINIEAGYQYSFNNREQKSSSHSFPLMVLRTGLLEQSELDIQWDGLNVDKEEGTPKETSTTDVSIGAKYKLLESEQYNLTALGMLSLPTGTPPSTSNSVDPLVGMLWDYSISDRQTLFGTLQTSSSILDGDRVFDIQCAIGGSISHTEAIGSFIEIYTIEPFHSGLNSTRVIDGGITYLLTNDTQLDFNVGIGLTKYSSNFIGFGIASRF